MTFAMERVLRFTLIFIAGAHSVSPLRNDELQELADGERVKLSSPEGTLGLEPSGLVTCPNHPWRRAERRSPFPKEPSGFQPRRSHPAVYSPTSFNSASNLAE
jgi:hypothetical protein